MRSDQNFMYFDEFHAWFEYMCKRGMVQYEYEDTTVGTKIVSKERDAAFNSESVHYLAEIVYPPNCICLPTLWDELAVKDDAGLFYKEIEWSGK